MSMPKKVSLYLKTGKNAKGELTKLVKTEMSATLVKTDDGKTSRVTYSFVHPITMEVALGKMDRLIWETLPKA